MQVNASGLLFQRDSSLQTCQGEWSRIRICTFGYKTWLKPLKCNYKICKMHSSTSVNLSTSMLAKRETLRSRPCTFLTGRWIVWNAWTEPFCLQCLLLAFSIFFKIVIRLLLGLKFLKFIFIHLAFSWQKNACNSMCSWSSLKNFP